VGTIEEQLGRDSSGSGLEIGEYGRGDPSRRPRGTLYPQKLKLTSQTSGGRSVGMVRSRTKATEFSFSLLLLLLLLILFPDLGKGGALDAHSEDQKLKRVSCLLLFLFLFFVGERVPKFLLHVSPL
jgi:hypothetical protein